MTAKSLPDGTTHAWRTPAHWRRVALIVAGMIGKRVGADTATRMAMDADLRDHGEIGRPKREQPAGDVDPLDELRRLTGEKE